MSVTRLSLARWLVAVAAWFCLEACAEVACEAGCAEEEADCLDEPGGYVLG